MAFQGTRLVKVVQKLTTVKIEVPVIDRKLKIIKGSDDTTVKGEEIAQSVQELVQLLRDDAKVL